MNAKTMLLAGALFAGITTSQAAMYTRTIQPGFCNLIANELNHPMGNTVGNVFSTAPPAVPLVLSKFIPATRDYQIALYDPEQGWAPGTMTLNPGEAAYLDNQSAAPFVLTFMGTLPADQPCPTLTACTPALLSRRMGWSTTGLVPSGYADLVGFEPMEGSTVFQYAGGADCSVLAPPDYNVFTFARGVWNPMPPMVAVGEAVWVQVPVSIPTNYTRTILAGACNLVANELNACRGNNINNVLPGAGLPAQMLALSKFIPGSSSFQTEFYDPDIGMWAPGTMVLNPGEGAFLASPVNFTATFRGVLPAARQAGCTPTAAGTTNLVSRRAGGLGPSTYEDIVGSPPVTGSTLYQFVPGGDCTLVAAPNYNIFTYAAGAWAPAPPVVAVGESVWVQLPYAVPESYTKAILPGACNLIANELNACGGNNVNNVLPGSGLPAAALTLYKFVGAAPTTYQTETYDPELRRWMPGTMMLNPGDGALLDSPVGFTATFRGTSPLPPRTSRCFLGGQPFLLSRRASAIGPSTYEDIVGAAPTAGSTLYQFIPGGDCSVLAAPNYNVYTYSGSAWSPAPPVITVGESVWVQVPASTAPLSLAIAWPCRGYAIELTWSGEWQLQCADFPTGPWVPIPGAVSPFFCSTLPPPMNRFFRLVCP